MIASPDDLEALDVNAERKRLNKALAPLQNRGLVELHWLEGSTWSDLQIRLRQGEWHIFHFVGHGTYDAGRDEGMVSIVSREGHSRLLTATELARLLADHNTLRLVLLNCCEGACAGELDLFSSTAATLVRRGLPAVLAMQFDITDMAAIQLSEAFYTALADGLPVDQAVAVARKAISLGMPNSLEWATPVLFMRSDDGRIFNIDPPSIQPHSCRSRIPPIKSNLVILSILMVLLVIAAGMIFTIIGPAGKGPRPDPTKAAPFIPPLPLIMHTSTPLRTVTPTRTATVVATPTNTPTDVPIVFQVEPQVDGKFVATAPPNPTQIWKFSAMVSL